MWTQLDALKFRLVDQGNVTGVTRSGVVSLPMTHCFQRFWLCKAFTGHLASVGVGALEHLAERQSRVQ